MIETCRHLGPLNGSAYECPDCPGKGKKLRLSECKVYGECVQWLGWKWDVAGCVKCPSHTPIEEVVRGD